MSPQPTRAELLRRIEELQGLVRTATKEVPMTLRSYVRDMHRPTPPSTLSPARQQILRLVRQHPGIHVSRLARLRGVGVHSQFKVVAAMERDGLLRTERSLAYGKVRSGPRRQVWVVDDAR